MLPAELIINSARAVLFRSTFPVCLFPCTPRKLLEFVSLMLPGGAGRKTGVVVSQKARPEAAEEGLQGSPVPAQQSWWEPSVQ